MDLLNELGIQLRFERLAKRRGKAASWVKKRVKAYLAQQKAQRKLYNQLLDEWMKLKEEEENNGQETS